MPKALQKTLLVTVILLLLAAGASAEEIGSLHQLIFRQAALPVPAEGEPLVSASCTAVTKDTRKRADHPFTVTVTLQEGGQSSFTIQQVEGFVFENPTAESSEGKPDVSGSLISTFESDYAGGLLEAGATLQFKDTVIAKGNAWVGYRITGTGADGKTVICYCFAQLNTGKLAEDTTRPEETAAPVAQDDTLEEAAGDDWYYPDDEEELTASEAEEMEEDEP